MEHQEGSASRGRAYNARYVYRRIPTESMGTVPDSPRNGLSPPSGPTECELDYIERVELERVQPWCRPGNCQEKALNVYKHNHIARMLANTLNTNEVKDSAGVEQEFSRLSTNDRDTEFAKIGETPSQPHRLSIKHQETGKGMSQRRRSVVRIDKTVISGVDSVTPVTVSAYLVLDAPIGAMSSIAEATNVIANLLSFCASTGATTTILYDGTGNGAKSLLEGGL